MASQLDACRQARQWLAIDRAGTFVGRAATEVCGSLEAGAFRPAAESLSDSDPSVEEVPLQPTYQQTHLH